jgi:hypothetical protein
MSPEILPVDKVSIILRVVAGHGVYLMPWRIADAKLFFYYLAGVIYNNAKNIADIVPEVVVGY